MTHTSKAIERHLTAWLDRVGSWESKRKALRRELSQLKRRGLTQGKPHWRSGRYLYLVHPVVGTTRQREYIGSDPAKIKAALARVERTEIYRRKRDELESIEQSLQRLLNELERLAFLHYTDQ